MASTLPTLKTQAPSRWQAAVRWSGTGLVAASWISASFFGAYIFAFYLGAIPSGRFDTWNQNVAGIYDRSHTAALIAIGAHMAVGAILLLLGPIQLIGRVRSRWPALHRLLGRIYIACGALAGLGGLGFIALKGTIGGTAMNLGFGLYGFLMVLSAVQAWRYAVARQFDRHRVWAVRLFALTIGSWLYRMDYGLWFTATNGLWSHENFRGGFDVVMAFFFYLPNLLVAELYLRGQRPKSNRVLLGAAAFMLGLAALVVAVGTYYFVHFYWGPAILAVFKH
jgi:uncharacterized membrane protein